MFKLNYILTLLFCILGINLYAQTYSDTTKLNVVEKGQFKFIDAQDFIDSSDIAQHSDTLTTIATRADVVDMVEFSDTISVIATKADASGSLQDYSRQDDTSRITTSGSTFKLRDPIKVVNVLDSVQGNYQIGTIIQTRGLATVGDGGGARYHVQADSVAGYATDTVAVIPVGSNYAVLQPTDNKYYVEHFGAIADDAVDDFRQIQNAINWCINTSNVDWLAFGPGVFELDSGLVVARPNGIEYDQVTIRMSGATPIYGQSIGGTILDINDQFGIIVQEGRKVQIENFYFRGAITPPGTFKATVEWDLDDWTNSGTYSYNANSPYAGIVIDAFSDDVTGGNRYGGYESYYTNTSNGGTSMMKILGCSFQNLVVGIANNVTNSGVNNGDNIVAENCNASNSYTFWSAGQTQSRKNVIENLYAVGNMNSIMTGRDFGDTQGTLPVLQNSNIAGGVKFIVKGNSDGFASTILSKVFAESIWAIFTGTTESLYLTDCELKFNTAEEVRLPQYVSTANTYVKGGRLLYFTNCVQTNPFPFYAHASFKDVLFEGGLPVGRFTNSGGEDLNDITIIDCHFKCSDGDKKEVGQNLIVSGAPSLNLDDIKLLGSSKVIDNQGIQYTNNGYLYDNWLGGAQTLNYVDSDSTEMFFTSATPGRFQAGDNLVTTTDLDETIMEGGTLAVTRSSLGYISSVSNDTIYISGIVYGYAEGSHTLYHAHAVEFNMPIIGDVVTGEDSIKNIVHGDQSFEVGDKIFGTGIYEGTYITEINYTDDFFIISENAFSTSSAQVYLPTNSGRFNKIWYDDDEVSPSNVVTWIPGDIIINKTSTGDPMWICTDAGVYGSAQVPVFSSITSSIYSGDGTLSEDREVIVGANELQFARAAASNDGFALDLNSNQSTETRLSAQSAGLYAYGTVGVSALPISGYTPAAAGVGIRANAAGQLFSIGQYGGSNQGGIEFHAGANITYPHFSFFKQSTELMRINTLAGSEGEVNIVDMTDHGAYALQVEGDTYLDDQLVINSTPPEESDSILVDGTTKVVKAMHSSDLNVGKELQIEMFAANVAVSTGDGNIAVTIPASMDDYDLTNVVASVHDKGITGTTDITIERWRAGAAVDMISTAVTLGDEWFAEDGVVDAANDDVNTGDRIYVNVDAIHSGTAPNGLSIVLEFRKS